MKDPEARLSAERWKQIEEVYGRAAELRRSSAEQAALLERLCAGDRYLRRTVERLLNADVNAGGFLETSALDVTARLLTTHPERQVVGRRIGPYCVERLIGCGGMGDVFRATDVNLQRPAALKILPQWAAFDTTPASAPSVNNFDRLVRLKDEARVLASLDHPNIAAIYGFEEAEGISAIVMELVEGPTLADRLGQGPIPMDEVLLIARQIAEALEAAHERGVVHRDLKPSNISLRPDGMVKVLDFGLATVLKAESAAQGPQVDAGVSPRTALMGTPAYLSPEQARLMPTDKRADIWSFGVVLYEMLCGRRAFDGSGTPDVLAAVVHDEIDWSALPETTPRSVRRLLSRCLERDVRQRLRDIGEARIALSAPDAADDVIPAPPASRRGIRSGWIASSALAGAAAVAAAAWFFRASPPPAPEIARFTHTLPAGRALTLPTGRHILTLSTDGTQFVYAANDRLYLQRFAEGEAQAVAGTESPRGLAEPAFSPDGRSIAFWSAADRAIKVVPTAGGPPVTVAPVESPFGLSWANEGLLFGTRREGILRVAPTGGTPEAVARVGKDEQAHGPQMLPGGHLLFTVATGYATDRWDKARVVVQSLVSGERKTVLENASDARYVSSGHIVYSTRDGVFAVPFDERRLEVTGAPRASVAGVRRSQGRVTGAVQFSVSNTGTLIFVPGAAVPSGTGYLEVVSADRHGKVERLPLPAGPYTEVRVSPDGRHLAIAADDRKQATISVYDRSGATTLRRLTVGGNNRAPMWSADSTRVAFQSDRGGDLAIFWQKLDGTATDRLTTPKSGEAHVPEAWVPNDTTFLFTTVKQDDLSLWTYSVRHRTAQPFGAVHSSQPMAPSFSPDGRWVAYAASEAETDDASIYLQAFPAGGIRHPLFVSRPVYGPANSPHKPLWSPDGSELFYVPRIGGFEVVRVNTRPGVTFGPPVPVPRPFIPGPPDRRRVFDIAPDGIFFGLVASEPTYAEEYGRSRIQVILNWLGHDR